MANKSVEHKAMIELMIGQGYSDAHIATAAECSERTVKNYRRRLRTAASDAAAARVAVAVEPEAKVEGAAEPEPLSVPKLIDAAFAAGIPEGRVVKILGVDALLDEPDDYSDGKVQALHGWVEAVARMRATKPDKWLAQMAEWEAAEDAERASKAIQYDDFQGFMEEVYGLAGRLLGREDMRYFVTQTEEIAKYRHPAML